MKTKKSTILVAFAAFAAIAAAGCGPGATTTPYVEPPVAEVRVETPGGAESGAFFQTVGRVKNVRESTLASKVMGTVRDIKVKAGSKVRRGQTLMRIDDADIAGKAQQAAGALAQARAALAITEANHKRFVTLFESGSASKAELDKATFDYDAARGALEQAQGAVAEAASYLAEARVAAPFDGVVVDTMIEEGEMVAPGRPLVRIEGQSALEFETTVNERDVAFIEIGQKAPVLLDAVSGEKSQIDGEISEIVPASDGTHSQVVRIALVDGAEVRSGLFGRVRFAKPDGAASARLAPSDRVVRRGQLAGVWVVDHGDRVRLRLVREGRASGDRTEIFAGVLAKDRIVTSDISELIDGQPAKVVN
ncbi:efflux RND transporter periplasmic adaptor subunit [bacterium]|nr:efflux RND transporter periplasmic adaptor subunit [bacterium]